MKKLLNCLLGITMAAAVLLNSGCATIFGHSNYQVSVNSNPPGSTITITDKKGVEVYKGTTPATVTLKSSAGYFAKGEYQIKFQMAGYDEKVVTVNSRLNGWYFGNLFIGGVVGMLIIDPASGAMYKIDQTEVNEKLQQTAQHAQASTELQIIDINSLPKSALKNLEKLN